MAYPQPNPDQYVLDLYKFWNLTTPLSSPGDIYESTQGSLAFCVGPDSDIANVNIAYFDEQVPTKMHLTAISPARSLTGLIAARNDQTYDPPGRPGRILFWAGDVYDPNFRPPGFNPLRDGIDFVPPILNVIQYFSSPPTLVPQRTDRNYLFQAYSSLGGLAYLVIPYYGRKYAYINFTNGNPTDPSTVGIQGLNYSITQDGSAHPYHQLTTIRAPAAVAPFASFTQIITTSANGMFDALVFSVSDGGPAPLVIRTSDTQG